MPDKLEEIRRNFRKNTGKLDNWLYHRRISTYFKPAQKDGEKTPDGQ